MDRKDSFILYGDTCASACYQLDNRELGELFRAIVYSAQGEQMPVQLERGTAQAAFFEIISAQIKRDKDRYQKKCARMAENARKSKRKHLQTNVSKSEQIGSDTDTDTVPDTDTDTVPDTDTHSVCVFNTRARDAEKIPCGELGNVYLTEAELEELQRYSGLIESVSRYKAASGKEYVNDYAAARLFLEREPDKYPLARPSSQKRTISKADLERVKTECEASGTDRALIREALEALQICEAEKTSEGVLEDIRAHIAVNS